MAASMGAPLSMTFSVQLPRPFPGLRHQFSFRPNQEQLTMSMWPSPSTSMGRSEKLSM